MAAAIGSARRAYRTRPATDPRAKTQEPLGGGDLPYTAVASIRSSRPPPDTSALTPPAKRGPFDLPRTQPRRSSGFPVGEGLPHGLPQSLASPEPRGWSECRCSAYGSLRGRRTVRPVHQHPAIETDQKAFRVTLPQLEYSVRGLSTVERLPRASHVRRRSGTARRAQRRASP